MLLQPKQLSGIIPVRRQSLLSPIDALLNTAIARFDSTTIVGTNPVTEWQNRGTGGSAYDLDIVIGTDANLITLESGVGLLTGTAGDYFSTLNSALARITGSIILIGYVTPHDWTPAAGMVVIGKWTNVASNRSYFGRILANGKLDLNISPDGSATLTVTSTAATGFTDGTGHWLQWSWNDATDKANFFTSDQASTTALSDITWVQLGDPDISLISVGIASKTAPVEVGSVNGGTASMYSGKVHRAHIIAGTDPTATPAVNFDSRDASVNTATWPATISGETWTANGDAFVNATQHTGIYSRGSVGLETTAGQSITGTGITVYAVFKPTLGTPGADQFIFDARSTAGSSLSLRSDESNADKYTLNQGSDIALSQAYDNDLQVYTAQFLGTASTKLTASAGSVTGDAGSENWDFGSIFMALGAGSTAPGLFLELGIFDVAHSAGQVAFLRNHYGAKYA